MSSSTLFVWCYTVIKILRWEITHRKWTVPICVIVSRWQWACTGLWCTGLTSLFRCMPVASSLIWITIYFSKFVYFFKCWCSLPKTRPMTGLTFAGTTWILVASLFSCVLCILMVAELFKTQITLRDCFATAGRNLYVLIIRIISYVWRYQSNIIWY